MWVYMGLCFAGIFISAAVRAAGHTIAEAVRSLKETNID